MLAYNERATRSAALDFLVLYRRYIKQKRQLWLPSLTEQAVPPSKATDEHYENIKQ